MSKVHTARARANRPRPSVLPHLVLALVVLGCASRAAAQFTQYVAPGSLANSPQELRERLEEGAESARWRLGKLRLDPRLHLRDVGYLDNVYGATDDEEKVSDYRALVAAGLNGYLPLGQKAMFSTFVTPEYSWWAKRDELSQFNLSAGAGLFGFFNRLTLSADGRRVAQENVINAEVSAPIEIEEERLSLGVEVEVQRSIFVFAALRSSDFRHSGAAEEQVPGLRLRELDRDYRSTRAGVRFELGTAWSLGIGLEESENDFPVDPGGRSNEGSNPFLELRYETDRLAGDLSYFDTELEFAEDSPLTSFNAETGSGRVTYRTPRGFSGSLYASRNVVFSVREFDSLFVEERLGIGVGRDQGQRLDWTIFVETGEADFTDPQTGDRVDDLSAYGLHVGFDLTDDIALVLSVEDISYDSTIPEFDRSTSSLGLQLAFRENLFPF